MASHSISLYFTLSGAVRRRVIIPLFSPVPSPQWREGKIPGLAISHRSVVCSAAPESATATVTGKEGGGVEKEAAAAPKPKPSTAKAAVKSLPELMEEEVIPSLREAMETQEDISNVELSFVDNRLEGSFLKKSVPFNFWAFFPDGVLTGPKGFSLSSYCSEVSTVEPFLIDEKKITYRHVVFWVLKRLAAQGILPVWKE